MKQLYTIMQENIIDDFNSCDQESKNMHQCFTFLNEKVFTFPLASVYYPFKKGTWNLFKRLPNRFWNSQSTKCFFPNRLNG